MYQIQDRPENVFHSHDLVVWHAHIEKGFLPVPGVVVCQEGNHVLIRVRVDGALREVAVSPDELDWR